MKVRKKPIVVDAVQWNGELPPANFPDWLIEAFKKDTTQENFKRLPLGAARIFTTIEQPTIAIGSLENVVFGGLGYWIIRGVRGEVYLCNPEIFAETYELADLTGTVIPPPEIEPFEFPKKQCPQCGCKWFRREGLSNVLECKNTGCRYKGDEQGWITAATPKQLLKKALQYLRRLQCIHRELKPDQKWYVGGADADVDGLSVFIREVAKVVGE